MHAFDEDEVSAVSHSDVKVNVKAKAADASAPSTRGAPPAEPCTATPLLRIASCPFEGCREEEEDEEDDDDGGLKSHRDRSRSEEDDDVVHRCTASSSSSEEEEDDDDAEDVASDGPDGEDDDLKPLNRKKRKAAPSERRFDPALDDAPGPPATLQMDYWMRSEECTERKRAHVRAIDERDGYWGMEDHIERTVFSRGDVVLEENMFPYDTPPGISHWTLWSRREMGEAEIVRWTKSWLLRNKPACVSWNYDLNDNNSIDVPHYHVFIREPVAGEGEGAEAKGLEAEEREAAGGADDEENTAPSNVRMRSVGREDGARADDEAREEGRSLKRTRR